MTKSVTIKKRRLWGELIERFKILKRFTNVDLNKPFPVDDLSRTRSNEIELRCRQIKLYYTKKFFFTHGIASTFHGAVYHSKFFEK